jgi:predicted PurR-regulated permease PerM
MRPPVWRTSFPPKPGPPHRSQPQPWLRASLRSEAGAHLIVEHQPSPQFLARRISVALMTATIVVGVAGLYWGRPVLIPIALATLLTFLLNPLVALATLLTFLLNPLVHALHRRRVPRAAAVLLVVLAVFSVLGLVTYATARQVTALASEFPQYRTNMAKKMAQLRSRSRALERIQRTFTDIAGEIQRQDGAAEEKRLEDQAEPSARHEEKPVPVVVKDGKNPVAFLPSTLGTVMERLVTSVMTLVLVIFMLLRLPQLRNRLVRLVGYGRLTTTTKALDEAAARISRYLLMQSLINATYGCCVGLGLYFIGLPYVVLLGFLAGTLRFIPYVGPPVGAVLPVALSIAVFDGWISTMLVIGLFAFLEALTSMFFEPLLYGQSVGVSEVGLLAAIAFWTWLWGPIGLALATPLTVCVVVLCKYIPELEFVELLLGDEPVVDAPLIYYQRLLARDTDEATEIAERFQQDHSPEEVCDGLFVPALSWTKRDAVREKLGADDRTFILETTRDLIEASALTPAGEPATLSEPPTAGAAPIRVLACPAHDALDEVALQMLGQLLDAKRFQFEVLSSEKLFSEMISAIREIEPQVVCVGSLAPDPLAPARQFSKRLHDLFPSLRILVCRWGQKEGTAELREQFASVGIDAVSVTVVEARGYLGNLIPILSAPEKPLEQSVSDGILQPAVPAAAS